MARVTNFSDAVISFEDRMEGELQAALSKRDTANFSWQDYDELVDCVLSQFDGRLERRHFEYNLPAERQVAFGDYVPRDTQIPLVYYEWPGPPDQTIICLGGIANSGRRFDYLGQFLSPQYRVVALDWAGRGQSGRLPELADYHLEGHAWQVEQLIERLNVKPALIIGSSLGAATVLHLNKQRPDLVNRVLFNDFGPFIPKERRRRRAAAVARHYVFRNPQDIFRRMGAAKKNTEPLGDAALLHHAHHLTRWSHDDQGRVYRHDLRALLAFREQAQDNLDLWDLWDCFDKPLLLLHGTLSTSLEEKTVDLMLKSRDLQVIKVEGAGHTPSLSKTNQLEAIVRWMEGEIIPSVLPSTEVNRTLFL